MRFERALPRIIPSANKTDSFNHRAFHNLAAAITNRLQRLMFVYTKLSRAGSFPLTKTRRQCPTHTNPEVLASVFVLCGARGTHRVVRVTLSFQHRLRDKTKDGGLLSAISEVVRKKAKRNYNSALSRFSCFEEGRWRGRERPNIEKGKGSVCSCFMRGGLNRGSQ